MDYLKYTLETCANFPLMGSYFNPLHSTDSPIEEKQQSVLMKAIGCLGLSALAFLGAAYYRYTQNLEKNTLRVGSYNILDPLNAVKWKQVEGLNQAGQNANQPALRNATKDFNWKSFSNWDTRKHDVAKNIQDADIVCLQEATDETLKDLSELTGYTIGPKGYFIRNEHEVFGNAIVFNPKKVEWIDQDSQKEFKFNDRKAASGLFKACGKTMRVTSVHIFGYNTSSSDPNDLAVRDKGDQELKEYINLSNTHSDDENTDVRIIAGDLNESPSDYTSNSEEEKEVRRINLLKNNGMNTPDSAHNTEPGKGRRIDWIADRHRVALTRIDMELETKQKQASDHLMTGAKFVFIDKSSLSIQNAKNKLCELVGRIWRCLPSLSSETAYDMIEDAP